MIFQEQTSKNGMGDAHLPPIFNIYSWIGSSRKEKKKTALTRKYPLKVVAFAKQKNFI